MHDLHRQEELSNVVALGLRAEEIVLAVGRLSRRSENPEDRPTIESCASILRALGSVASPFAPHGVGAGLMSAEGFMDALRVVRAQAPNADVQAYATSLADALEQAVESEDEHNEETGDRLESVRDLFRAVGRSAIARANDLSQPSQEYVGLPR